MVCHLISSPGSSDPVIRELQSRLDEFYSTTAEYSAFTDQPKQAVWHSVLSRHIDRLVAAHGRIRVLEYGAGKTSFSKTYENQMNRIEFHVQDVTTANKDYLEQVADCVHIGDISEIQGKFHMIFSTFVFEHVATPTVLLTEVDRLLLPGGVHILICPRYDVPGHVCPSLRHLRFSRRLLTYMFLIGSDIFSKMSGQTRFWVNCDPAVFHCPWFRDADAVHIVSRTDVERWHRRHGYSVEYLTSLVRPNHNWRDYVSKKFLTLAMACTKQ